MKMNGKRIMKNMAWVALSCLWVFLLFLFFLVLRGAAMGSLPEDGHCQFVTQNYLWDCKCAVRDYVPGTGSPCLEYRCYRRDKVQ